MPYHGFFVILQIIFLYLCSEFLVIKQKSGGTLYRAGH